MQKFKQMLFKLPEYYLIVLVFALWYPMKTLFNPVAITLLVILLVQLFYKNKVVGFLIAGLFLLTNLYMFAAAVSEFSEFSVVNAEALLFLLGGTFLIALNVTMSIVMISGYSRIDRSVS